MASVLTLVLGTGPARPGACMALAMGLLHHARQSGLSNCRISASRTTNSDSRYLSFVDAAGRPWTIRVSRHRRKRGEVHLDLTALDGSSGIDQARAFIDRIVAGDVRWFELAKLKFPPRRKKS